MFARCVFFKLKYLSMDWVNVGGVLEHPFQRDGSVIVIKVIIFLETPALSKSVVPNWSGFRTHHYLL